MSNILRITEQNNQIDNLINLANSLPDKEERIPATVTVSGFYDQYSCVLYFNINNEIQTIYMNGVSNTFNTFIGGLVLLCVSPNALTENEGHLIGTDISSGFNILYQQQDIVNTDEYSGALENTSLFTVIQITEENAYIGFEQAYMESQPG